MIPLYLQFQLNENDKALRATIKHPVMHEYWYSERMRIYNQYFMPRLTDAQYYKLTIY
jgi:hypothetical protein